MPIGYHDWDFIATAPPGSHDCFVAGGFDGEDASGRKSGHGRRRKDEKTK
jgi:hypothetical protein